MYGEPAMAQALATAVSQHADAQGDGIEVVMCPPGVLIAQVNYFIKGAKRTKLGGQDCHGLPEGAYTGETSAKMLKDAGAAYVIVGHSERRTYYGETNEVVRLKAARALQTGLTPIICIGESEAERKAGQALEVVGKQVRESLPKEAESQDFVLAYEPVWAIGSGATPTTDDIAAMHAHILAVASGQTGKNTGVIPVLYGGSVKGDNARDILHTAGVGGVLVGGASLKAEEFCRIISAAV